MKTESHTTGNPGKPRKGDGTDHEAEYQAAVLRIAERRERDAATTAAAKGLWLSHHQPEQFDRCVQLGGRHVCRRCLALHPLSIVIAVVSALGYAPWPTSWDPAAIWVLSLPATLDFLAEQLDLAAYNAKRQVAATLVTAFAFGRALGYELADSWSSEFWGPLAVFGGIWFAAAYIAHQRREAGIGPAQSSS